MNFLKNAKARTAGLFLALVAMFVAAPAMAAAGDVGDIVVTAITGVNPQIMAVLAAMASALVLIVAWRLIKSAFGK